MFVHDHVALTVKDLAVSRGFYEYLGGRVVSKPSKAFMEIVLGEIRLHLVPAEGDTKAATAPRIDHLCLRVGSVDDLTSVEARVNAHPLLQGRAPCHVEDSPPLGEGGKEHAEERPPRKTLYFEDPDGIRLEVRAYS
ncbi:MAG: VOC family protein [Labilithrix sp.]|nr:VOC family protein [Labilithrix sp.]MCW5813113.1 VOC family protein [Labilithrix sp.]